VRCLVNFNKNQFFAIFGAFFLGGVITFYTMEYFQKDKSIASIDITPQKVFAQNTDRVTNTQSSRRDAQSQMDLIRQQMRKQMDQMMNSPFGSSPFDHDMGAGFESGVQITSDEDGQYKYIKISGEGVDTDTLDIQIKRGMISISGQVEKVSGDGQGSRSSYISKFSQSFNTPDGVDEEDVTMDTKEDSVILKFKKIEI